MRANELISQLQETMRRNKELDKELMEESPLWRSEMHEDNPIVYISIGPKCIPITLELNTTSTVYGSINGLCVGAELDLPNELYQRWFDLQQDIMKHLRDKE